MRHEGSILSAEAEATRIAGVPKLIEHGVSGELVPPGDGPALTAGILRLLNDSELRLRYAEAGRAAIEARYDFARRMTRLARAYDELLERVPD